MRCWAELMQAEGRGRAQPATVIAEMAAKYSATYPSAMKCLTTDQAGLTAYLRFPAEHYNRVRHSNFI